MKRSSVLGICVGLALAATQMSGSVYAHEQDNHSDRGRGNAPESVTVSFGVGLNTAQPGNAANHHVLPQVINVKAGGVVNFAVAGFHQIFAYLPGKDVGDVTIADPAATFIDDLNLLYYRGIVPVPPGAPGVTTNPSNAINRLESVAFSQPGVYLVICNVRGHFLDGMYAYVRVTP